MKKPVAKKVIPLEVRGKKANDLFVKFQNELRSKLNLELSLGLTYNEKSITPKVTFVDLLVNKK